MTYSIIARCARTGEVGIAIATYTLAVGQYCDGLRANTGVTMSQASVRQVNNQIGLDLLALVFGVAGGYVATVGVLGGSTGGFFTSFFANTTFADLLASVIKVAIFGLLIGVICGYYGLTASGGPAGVGRAVNRAVVACLVAIFFVNLVYTQWFLALFPDVSVFR